MFGSVKAIQKRSKDALSVFSKVLKTLEVLNFSITNETEKRSREISILQSEIYNLDNTQKQNLAVIDKINNIIN